MVEPETVPFDERVFGNGVVNPSETATPSSLLCDIHYAKIRVQGIWDPERVLRLCGLLQLTRYELASLVHYPHQQMKKSMDRGLFPGTVCLLFSILENQFVPAGHLLDAIPEDPDVPLIPSQILCNGTTKTSQE